MSNLVLGGFFWFRIKKGDGLFESVCSLIGGLVSLAERILSSEELCLKEMVADSQ
jgi:hypothetical protein